MVNKLRMGGTEVFDTCRRWKPWVSCVGAGALVLCLSFTVNLEGASPTNTKSNGDRAFSATVSGVPGGLATADGIAVYRSGRLDAAAGVPIAAPIVVDYRDDEASRLREAGLIVGPWRPGAQNAVAAAGACSFNIDCDDCDPCTIDRCLIAAGDPFGSGKCSNEAIPDGGGSSACSDGLFCNGIETCQAGVCELPGFGTGTPTSPETAIPCTGACHGGPDHGDFCTTDADCRDGACLGAVCYEDRAACSTPCTVRTCDDSSAVPGAVCTADADCGAGGLCQTPDQMCDNGIQCDGIETCDLTTGACLSGTNPCGLGGRCGERSCSGGFGANGPLRCSSDNDCGTGRTCLRPDDVGYNGPSCGIGRCCTVDPADPTSSLCSKQIESNCVAADQAWSPSATLFDQPQAECGNCPKYSGGISPRGDFTVVVGPVSNSTCGALDDLGDDYAFSNGSFVSVEEIVFVGGVRTVAEERMSVEFYDAAGGFIEDTFFASGSGIAVRTLEFDPPITLPPNGFVVWRVAGAFAPNGQIFIAATDVADVGTNDPAIIWAGGGSVSNWIQTCVGGTEDGLWCNPANTDCVDGGGVCDTPGTTPNVLAFELTGTKTPDPSGACCDLAAGTCTPNLLPWVCENGASPGVFRGIGQFCGTCSATGLSPNGECTADVDCRGCVGGANNLLPCTTGADCPGGTCEGFCTFPCLVGACCNSTTGVCTPDQTEAACVGSGGTFLGFGTDCDPDCCPQPVPMGADECALTTPVTLSIPVNGQCEAGANIGQPCLNAGDCLGELCSRVVRATVTGDNSAATGPDSCSAVQFDPVASDVQDVDPGWWESFTIDDCAFVRLDMCCSVPLHAPQWVVMWNACPCQDGQGFFNSINPNDPNLPANNRGAPFCDDDNLWWQYGPLRPGRYYQPIFSALAGAHGPYQLHYTATACPDAACCYSKCTESGTVACASTAECGVGETCLNGFCVLPCQVDADCTGTCEPICELTNVLECGDIGGNFLAPPARDTGVAFCDNTPGGGTCGTGACCRGPGVCEDSQSDQSFIPITKLDCDNVAGVYVGGMFCAGGVCVSGSVDQSCSSDADCGGGLGSCQNRAGQDQTQPSPCPVCELLDNAHCMFQTGFGFISDNCVGDCVTDPTNGHDYVAEDFVADESGDITTGCVAGSWLDQAPGGLPEGSADRTPERLFVTIYDDANGVPGAAVSPTQRVSIDAAGIEFFNGSRAVWRYQWTLPTPVPVLQGRTYWIEAYMDSNGLADDGTPAGRADVDWFWSGADPLDTRGPQGNSYSMLNTGLLYDIRDVNPGADHAFCLNIAMSVPPEPKRPCCVCPTAGGVNGGGSVAAADPNCRDAIGADECINDLQGDWRFEVNECLNFTCPNTNGPVNDDCINATEVFNGSVSFNNLCATDSPAPLDQVACGGIDTDPFTRDMWFTYHATETSDWKFSLCDKEGEFDTVLALYSNNTATCPCPSDATDQLGDCSDDGCVFVGSGSELTRPVTAGTCYLIRVGGFGGAQGIGLLTVEKAIPDFVAPPAVTPDTVTITPNRTLRTSMPLGTPAPGTLQGVRVTVVSLDGFGVPTPNTYWVGPPIQAPEENSAQPGLTYTTAPLQCAPYFRDWSADGIVAIHGAEIMPGSEYIVQQTYDSCDFANSEMCFSPAVTMTTATFGDVVDPFWPNGLPQPNFRDISDYVSKFLGSPTAGLKSVLQLQPNVLNPMNSLSFKDISNDVGAFLGGAYSASLGITGPCTCPSAVTCGAAVCATDNQCGGGFCIGGFCTDECGRCEP